MKLQAKVSLFLSTLLLAALLSQGGIVSYFLDQSLRIKANQDLLQEADQVSNRLDVFILNSQTDIMNIAHNMNIQALLEGKLSKVETYLESAFFANTRFDNGFFILDAQANLVVDYPVSQSRGINLAFREYFKRTFSEKKPIISSPYISKRTGARVITFTVPLLSYQGDFLGLFAGSVNLLRYSFAGGLRDIQIGQTGKIMVYDSQGEIIYYPNRDLTSPEAEPPYADPMLRGLPQGSKGVMDRQATDGTKYVMAFHPLETTNWMVGVILNKEEILYPLNSLKKQIALFLIVALVVAVGIGIWGMGILVKPIKAFSNSIKQYKGGDWEEPAGLISRRDEMGELGKSFKSMTSLLSETLSSLTESETKYRALIQGSLVGVFLIQRRRFVFVNPRLLEIFGYSQEEMVSSFDPLDLVVPKDRDRVLKNMTQPLSENHRLVHFFWQGLKKDGSLIEVEVMGTPMLYQGKPAIHGTLVDITERKLLERKHQQLNRLREELITAKPLQEKLKIITDGIVNIFKTDFARIWIVKPGDRCSECRHAQVKEGPHICRYKDQCLHLKASSGRYTHIDGEVHCRMPYGCYKIGRLAAGEISKLLTNDVIHDPLIHNHDWAQELGLVSFAGYRLVSAEGVAIGVMALFSRQVISSDDDTLLKGLANSTAQVIQTAKIEETLRESEERYRTAIEQSNDGIALVKGDRHVYVNQKMVEIFGYDRPEEIIGQPVSMVIHPDDQERVVDINLRRQKGEAVPQKYEFKGQLKNGEPIYIEVSATKTTYQGEPVSLAYLRDISDRKQAEEALKTLSLKDDLTGLYNRRGFFALAEQALKTAQRMGTEMLLMYGDLDNMKQINDTLGHKEGDRALIDMSYILKEIFRESDIIARIGGDEFVILAINSFEDSAEKLITRFEKALNDHHLQKGRSYTLSMSLGIASFNPQNPSPLDELLSRADRMMYENKQKGYLNL
jgi:diguanylate cyclase (GGDEF)-like protein/PAS domain S-box-containing protein